MKQLLLIAVIASLIIACGNAGADQNSGAGASATAAAGVTDEGKKIYKQYCVTCHGLYGDMGATGAFNLQETELTLEERITVITHGRNTMTGFSTLLTEDKIKAVAQYTFELKNAK
ncbi:MAG: cytochrome c [Saprospiraceae bacterium]|nr:cytochrome c [Saprospiraceae bacterium]